MARSPFTLAATVTSALPGVGVVGVAPLTEGASGRYDTAVADLDDGRRVVIRVPNDARAERELVAQLRALRSLSAGVRAVLPFRAPTALGETTVDGVQAGVVDLLDGYRVDAAELPPGRGVATGIGAALAALHALPPTVVRAAALPAQTPEQVHAEVSRLLDRVAGMHRIPVTLLRRWSSAAATERLWRFESTVVGGGVSAESFLLEDVAGVPRVTGLLDWHGFAVGDPAVDLRWLSSAPAAANDVFDAYAAEALRAPDAALRTRARLYAELEFARWLVHGDDEERDDIVADAVGLLEALAANVRDDDLIIDDQPDADDALAAAKRMPRHSADVDTSMQTDAFDPSELAGYVDLSATTDLTGSFDPTGVLADRAAMQGVDLSVDPNATAPIDLSSWADEHAAANPTDDALRASEAARRR
jgi:macrolide phosphotransferase